MNTKRWAKVIALNVRACRADAGMTQTALAGKMGCLVPTISRLESGSHLPSLKTLLLVAESLGVTPCRLLQQPE